MWAVREVDRSETFIDVCWIPCFPFVSSVFFDILCWRNSLFEKYHTLRSTDICRAQSCFHRFVRVCPCWGIAWASNRGICPTPSCQELEKLIGNKLNCIQVIAMSGARLLEISDLTYDVCMCIDILYVHIARTVDIVHIVHSHT